MRRRSSGSADEDDIVDPVEAGSLHPDDGETRKSFTSAKDNVSRHSDSLDRRKVEKTIAPAQTSANGSAAPGELTSVRKQLLLPSDHGGSKMPETRIRRRSRMQSPWSCSLLTVSTTIMSTILLLSTIHSFLTRQVDLKGCDMCYTREMIYFKFADFDTEHTRFASKYSLHLIREQGFDEDPKV